MRRRVIVCLGLLLTLCLVGSAIALFCLHSSIEELSALAEAHRIQVMRANLTSSAVRIERDLISYEAGRGPDAARSRDSVRRFEQALGECGGCHHQPSVQADLDAVRGTFDSYIGTVNQLVADGTGWDPALERDANLIADRLARQSTGLSDRGSSHVGVRSTDAAASVRNAWLVLLGTLLVALVAGALVALHLHRRLTVPIAALLDGIEHVRKGNLDHRFSLEGDEEFRALGNALNDAYRNLKTAQEGVLQAEKMAAVGKLAAGVAHEVANPLASISSVVQMMRRKGQSPEQAERIDLIMQHIARVSRVVRELLTFSRPADNGRHGRVDISALLDRAVSLLRYDERAGQTEIACRYEPGLSMARGDADRLLLVFTNIMINTFDALSMHGNGHPRLTISARQNGDRIIIRFKDNGPGMDKEQIRDAFEPFFTTKDPGTGTGLGLWICYEVVRKHQGTIRIDSRVGKGTAVIIELPKDAPMTDSTADDAPALEAQRS